MATREEWVTRIERWAESGKPGQVFAAELGVKVKTLYNWKSRLQPERTEFLAEAKQFVELIPAPAHVSADPVRTEHSSKESETLEVVLHDGLRVRVPCSFDQMALRRLLDTLEAR